MSAHFIHSMKYSHYKRRLFFKGLIKSGEAIIVERLKYGFVVKSVNGVNYKISRKGRVIKDEQPH